MLGSIITATVGIPAVIVVVLVLARRNSSGVGIAHHAGTTAQISVLYPWQSSSPPSRRGLLIGHTSGGGIYTYCPYELYAQQKLTSPNMIVLGQVGTGKSALIKSWIRRNRAHGRRAVVVDPKGEFDALAAAVDGTVIRLEPGGGIVLNPLDAGHEEAFDALTAIVGSVLNRALSPIERTGLRLALDQARGAAVTPTLSDVCAALFDLDATSIAHFRETPDSIVGHVREAGHALWGLCNGPLGLLLDGPTTPGLDLDAPLVVVDISTLGTSGQSDDDLRVVMAAVLAWLNPILLGPGQKTLVIDEAWRLLLNLETARWLRALFKLSRKYGLSNCIVMHRLSDLQAAGDDASETYKLALGLLADAQTRIVYQQADDQLTLTQDLLGLTGTERDALRHLGKGQALWRVGLHSALVAHRLTPTEMRIVDTDEALRIPAPDPGPVDTVLDDEVAAA